MFPEASSDSLHPSSEAPSASPPPSRRTFEASRPSATITAPLLVVDPNVVIPPFKKDSVLRRFEAGRKQDLEEEEVLLVEFEQLTRDFTLWMCARVQGDDTVGYEGTMGCLEDIEMAEKEQATRMGEMRGFLESVKKAFKTLTGMTGL